MNIKEFHGCRTDPGHNAVLIIYTDHPSRLLPNHVPDQSPVGFEWGYGGVESFALAKSILHEINPKYAKVHWLVHVFLWNFIATLSDDEWTLPIKQIENFIARKTANITTQT